MPAPDLVVKFISTRVGAAIAGQFGEGAALTAFGEALGIAEFENLKNRIADGTANPSDVIQTTLAVETALLGAGIVGTAIAQTAATAAMAMSRPLLNG